MSKKFNKSDYRKNMLNKAAVVYSHNGETVTVTYENVSENQPEINQEKFKAVKDASDDMFHLIDILDAREARHKMYSYDDEHIPETMQVKSVEDAYIEAEEKRDFTVRYKEAMATLTETQRRRLRMRTLGMTLDEISKIEECNINAVKKSITQARERLRKFFPEMKK